MEMAISEAEVARDEKEVPVGCVIVKDGAVIASAHNQVEGKKDALAHAEMLAISMAETFIGDWRLEECDIYVTLEPCPMCAAALSRCRIRRVIFGAPDSKAGALGGLLKNGLDERLEYRYEVEGGVLEERCSKMLKDFFVERRSASASDEATTDES